jgi:membrane protease YdiL (CAAX protease family)
MAAPQVAGLGGMTDPEFPSDTDVLPGSRCAGESPSPQPPHWGFFATMTWAVVIMATHASLQLGTFAAVAKWYHTAPAEAAFWELVYSATDNGYFFSLSIFVTTIVGCAAIARIVKLKPGSSLVEYLAIKPVSLRTMLAWSALLVVLLFLEGAIGEVLGLRFSDDFMPTIYATSSPAWMLWLAVIIGAPLFEETFFRGFLFAGLATSFVRPIGAAVVTAAMWTALHMQYDGVGTALLFFLGLLLGAARIASGSLLAPLGIHALENLLALLKTVALQ